MNPKITVQQALELIKSHSLIGSINNTNPSEPVYFNVPEEVINCRCSSVPISYETGFVINPSGNDCIEGEYDRKRARLDKKPKAPE